jgi:hypothetical protein
MDKYHMVVAEEVDDRTTADPHDGIEDIVETYEFQTCEEDYPKEEANPHFSQ